MFTLENILRNHLENVDFLNSASVRCNAGAFIVFHAQLGSLFKFKSFIIVYKANSNEHYSDGVSRTIVK